MNKRLTKKSESIRSLAGRTAALGILFALAVVLSLVESAAPLPFEVPGLRLGLSNIVVMYCVFSLGAGCAFTLGILKSLSALMARGAMGALLSLAGGMSSISVMLAMLFLGGGKPNYTVISIAGAVAHNMAQLCVAVFLLDSPAVLGYYFPALAAAGVLVGTLTAVLLRTLLPALERLGPWP